MTDEELEDLTIIKDGSKIHPNRYWCNTTQTNMNILPTDTRESILMKIFEEGVSQGVVRGKIIRSEQISELLNNTDT